MANIENYTVQVLREILELWPDWRTFFLDRGNGLEQQLKTAELNPKLLTLIRSIPGGMSYLDLKLHDAEIALKEELEKKLKLEFLRQDRELKVKQYEQNKLQVFKDLEDDYLKSSQSYEGKYSKLMTEDEFLEMRKEFVCEWLDSRDMTPPSDDEQLAAIATVENNVRVIARAGSGKTTTLVRRFIFLQEHCRVQPHEMLLLAFNRKAADNMREQFEHINLGRMPHIMTFHALAYALVHPEQALLMDDPEDDGAKNQSRRVQALVDDFIQRPEQFLRVRRVMLSFFRRDWEEIIKGGYDKPPDELIDWRRSIPYSGLDGWDYRSRGEKLIADFLFEHDIHYQYERQFYWDKVPYKPDFTLSDATGCAGIIIEYYGLQGDPDYDAQILQKRGFWEKRKSWKLLELSPRDFSGKNRSQSYEFLQAMLLRNGISCKQLSEEQLWSKLVSQRLLDKFTSIAIQFIQRCRQQAMTPTDLAQRIEGLLPKTKSEQLWLELAADLYSAYLDWLRISGEDDFNGLLQKAASQITKGHTKFSRKNETGDLRLIKFIAIDEYQDFSELFHQLLLAIRKQSPAALCFCVGDDWQAINSFAGSELRFFEKFSEYFPNSIDRYVTTNYRSTASIVNLSNQLMANRGKSSRSFNRAKSKVCLANINDLLPTKCESEKYSQAIYAIAILRLVYQAISNNLDVVLLSRTNTLPWAALVKGKNSNSLDVFLNWLRQQFPVDERNRITISTVHKYKGSEKNCVIVLDALTGRYPLIHKDSFFFRIFGITLNSIIDDERRLFYVAISRPQQELYLLTDSREESPFIKDIREQLTSVDWGDYLPFPGQVKNIYVKIFSTGDGVMPLNSYLQQSGYQWMSSERCWLRRFLSDGFTFSSWLEGTYWACLASITIRFYDDKDKQIAEYSLNYCDEPTCHFDNIKENIATDDLF